MKALSCCAHLAVRVSKPCGAAGPEEELRKITQQLQADGVFVREVETLGLAFHSPALDPLLPELKKGIWSFGTESQQWKRKVSFCFQETAPQMVHAALWHCSLVLPITLAARSSCSTYSGPSLCAELEEVIPEPKERPASWISTSFHQGCDDPTAMFCSADYQVCSWKTACVGLMFHSNIKKLEAVRPNSNPKTSGVTNFVPGINHLGHWCHRLAYLIIHCYARLAK